MAEEDTRRATRLEGVGEGEAAQHLAVADSPAGIAFMGGYPGG